MFRPSHSFPGFVLTGLLALAACGAIQSHRTLTILEQTPLLADTSTGDITPVRDPSIILHNGVYHLFASDSVNHPSNQFLAIRCSPDKVNWTPCGQVFTAIPAWVESSIPNTALLWAPDISYFGGLFHVYYAGSTLNSQSSVIGLATNTTLNPADPAYQWVDRGQVIASHPDDDFNAIDPNLFIDGDHTAWLTYGSYWSGIKQRQIDPATGMLLAANPRRYDLAARPGTSDDAIEAASLVKHGSFYYLFLSADHCCEGSTAQDDYKQIVGRSASVHGPFFDAAGASLTDGGGSIILQANGAWFAPGGGTAYIDPTSGESTLVFHAVNTQPNINASLWVKKITWQNDWPVLN